MNNFSAIGRLGEDPELRTTNTGKTVASFNFAINRRFKNKDGEKETDWFRVHVWGQNAEYACKYLRKGMRAAVNGPVEIEKYTSKDGIKGITVNIAAGSITSLDRLPDEIDTPAQTAAFTAAVEVDSYDPFSDEL